MRVVVLGCGSIGRRHIRNILSLNGLSVIAVDSDPEAAALAAREFGVSTRATLESALQEKPHCVFIATPPSSHVQPALSAARAGCDLFIEKPLSHSLDGIRELITEVNRRRLVAMVGCNMRFHPNIAFMKSFLDEGRLGKMYSVHAEAGSYLPNWRPGTDYRLNYGARKEMGGGVLLDSIHEMDYLSWLVGDVVDVQCLAGKVSSLEIDSEDLALILVRFSNGALGSIHLDYLQQSYCRTSKFVGEEGILSWDMNQGSVRFYHNGSGSWKEMHAIPIGFHVNQLYIDEIRCFFHAVRERTSPMSDIHDAVKVLKITLKGKESAEKFTCRRV